MTPTTQLNSKTIAEYNLPQEINVGDHLHIKHVQGRKWNEIPTNTAWTLHLSTDLFTAHFIPALFVLSLTEARRIVEENNLKLQFSRFHNREAKFLLIVLAHFTGRCCWNTVHINSAQENWESQILTMQFTAIHINFVSRLNNEKK
jgi:hypothetical protein